MKTFTQIVLPIALFAVVVGGVTFTTQFTAVPPPKAAPKAAAGAALQIPHRLSRWDADRPDYAAEIELGTRGQYDFWFTNPNDKPVIAQLLSKSCTCSEVEIAFVPPDDAAAVAAATPYVKPPADARPPMPEAVAKTLHWTGMLAGNAGPVTVPAGRPDAAQIGVLRMKWNTRGPGPFTLVAELVTRLPGAAADAARFEVRTVTVPALMSLPVSTALGDLHANDKRSVEVYFWTATRPTLEPSAELMFADDAGKIRGNPNVEVGPAEAITGAALKALPAKLESLMSGLHPTRPLAAFKTLITVHESREGRQLDLGPFRARVLGKGGDKLSQEVDLNAMVRGVIHVGGPKDNDRLDLGNFRSDRPHEKSVVLSSNDPAIRLKLLPGWTPAELQVTLAELNKPGSVPREWELRVGVPADAVSGVLPPGSAVTLEADTVPPRRVRVPVSGNGFN